MIISDKFVKTQRLSYRMFNNTKLAKYEKINNAYKTRKMSFQKDSRVTIVINHCSLAMLCSVSFFLKAVVRVTEYWVIYIFYKMLQILNYYRNNQINCRSKTVLLNSDLWKFHSIILGMDIFIFDTAY